MKRLFLKTGGFRNDGLEPVPVLTMAMLGEVRGRFEVLGGEVWLRTEEPDLLFETSRAGYLRGCLGMSVLDG